MYFKQFYLGCLAHASYMIGSNGLMVRYVRYDLYAAVLTRAEKAEMELEALPSIEEYQRMKAMLVSLGVEYD